MCLNGFLMLVPFLNNLLFSRERQKGSGSDWERRWGGTRRSRGIGKLYSDYIVQKKSLFN